VAWSTPVDDGRGMSPARDGELRLARLKPAFAFLREALLLARVATTHDEDSEQTDQSQRDTEHCRSLPAPFIASPVPNRYRYPQTLSSHEVRVRQRAAETLTKAFESDRIVARIAVPLLGSPSRSTRF
jgi:hypothetical protein